MTETMITPLYAAIFALFFVFLSVRTILIRRKMQVAIGYGDQPRLERAARAHANFSEYVPIGLLLIYFLELRVGSALWIHALGTLLFIGRLSHAYGVSQMNEDFRFRVFGMALTFAAIATAALRILISYLA